MNRPTAAHISLYAVWHLFVLSVQTLHCLVLGLFGARLDLLNLCRVFRVVLVYRGDLEGFLRIDLLHFLLDLRSVHVLINGLSMTQ